MTKQLTNMQMSTGRTKKNQWFDAVPSMNEVRKYTADEFRMLYVIGETALRLSIRRIRDPFTMNPGAPPILWIFLPMDHELYWLITRYLSSVDTGYDHDDQAQKAMHIFVSAQPNTLPPIKEFMLYLS